MTDVQNLTVPTNVGRRLLKMSDVKVRTGVSPSTIYRWIDARKFPRPIKFSETCARWREADIESWIEGKAAASDPDAVAPAGDGGDAH